MSAGSLRVAVMLTAAVGWLLASERATAAWQGVAGVRLSPAAWLAEWGLLSWMVLGAAVVCGLIIALQRRGPRAAGFVAAALVAGVGLAAVGRALTTGAWISTQWFAPAVPAGLALAGVVAGVVLVRLARRPGLGTTLLFVEAALAATVADTVVMPGRYPAFHFAMAGVATLSTTVAALRVASRMRRRLPGELWIPVLTLALLGAQAWRGMSADVRAELLLRSPLCREVLRANAPSSTSRLRAVLAQLPPAEDDARDESLARRDASPLVAPDVNVLVITIDALRADALPPGRTGDRVFAREGDTPNIDQLLSESTVFSRVYAPASFTMRSLPAIFASRPPHEDHEASAGALAETMRQLDRIPLAVAARYFIEEPEGRSILEGFAAVEVHARTRQDQGVDQLLQLIDSSGDRPFFAWMHLMATHEPGFSGRQLGRGDGSWPERYRRSLRWVDGEVGRLRQALHARGLDERTIVVFASDHGEGLGDNGINVHGESVFEEEVRVPLALRLPQGVPQRVDATVGLVDLVPTLVELLGGAVDPHHVGRSLVPLLRAPAAPWVPRDYFVMSRRDTYGLVRGTDKLVYDAKADAFLRFDLAADPTEDADLHREHEALDGELRSAFVRRYPVLFAKELRDTSTLALLRQRLRELDPRHETPSLRFLLQLTALAADDAAVAQALAMFAPGSVPTKAAIVELLLAKDPRVEPLAIEFIEAQAGGPDERAFVEQLAARGVPMFAPAAVAARLREVGPATASPTTEAYLRLLGGWTQIPVEATGEVLGEAAASESPAIAALALRASRGLAHAPGGAPALAAAAVAALTHPAETMRMDACHTLAAVGDATALPALRTALQSDDEDIRVRQACLNAAVEAAGEAAVDLVIEQAGDRMIAFYALRLLARLRSPAAIPFLERTIAAERHGRIHAAAVQALRLTKRAPR